MRAFIVTGSRDWTDQVAIYNALIPISRGDRVLMIHGAARGADELGASVWHQFGGRALPMPAQWSRDGNSAGPKRNNQMLRVLLALRECGYEVSVEAFSLPQSKGTKHMKEIAEKAGVVVNEHGRPE